MTEERGRSKWEAQTLRVTTFMRPDADFSGMRSWWKEVVGSEPDEEVSRPNTGHLAQAGHLEENRLAMVTQSPVRVDWHLAPSQPQDEIPQQLASIGPFPMILQSFVPIAQKWLEVCPLVARLAFGAALVERVDDLKTGYVKMSGNLPAVKIDPEGSSDFFYQINRPRQLSVDIPERHVNRLTKWSVIRSKAALLTFTVGPESASVTSEPEKDDLFACRLVLDISTTGASSGELPKSKLRDVLDELITLGRELADEGEKP